MWRIFIKDFGDITEKQWSMLAEHTVADERMLAASKAIGKAENLEERNLLKHEFYGQLYGSTEKVVRVIAGHMKSPEHRGCKITVEKIPDIIMGIARGDAAMTVLDKADCFLGVADEKRHHPRTRAAAKVRIYQLKAGEKV